MSIALDVPCAVLPVGRDRELNELRLALRDAHFSAQIVRIAGEPWVGKSRLLLELATMARAEGWTVAQGSSPRPSYDRPFEVVVDALDAHAGRLARSPADARPPAETELLAEIFPSLRQAVGALPPDRAPDRGYRALRAVRVLLERLAEDTGLLLVLDDLHRADPQSIDLLEHLTRHPPRGPVLVVVAFRGAATETAWPHDRLLTPGPLGDVDAAALLPAGLSPQDRDRLVRRSEGVPGLLLALAAQGPQSGYAPHPALGGPDLRALSPTAARVLQGGAAAAGRDFSPHALAEIAQLPLADVLGGIDELSAEGLVTSVSGGTTFRLRRPALADLASGAGRAGWQFGAHARAAALDAPERTDLATLTKRELEVATLVSHGDTNQQIARALELSPKTVETHISRMFTKLGLRSRTQIAHLIGTATATGHRGP